MNPHKGEVALFAGDKTYTLHFSIDALCDLETATGKGFSVLAEEMADPKRVSVTLVRQLLAAALHDRHPEITLKEAGEIIPVAGGVVAVMAKVSEALSAAFPAAEGKPRDPRKGPRRAGTGRPS